MAFRCEQCNQLHDGLPEFGFQRPDVVWEMSSRDRQRRSLESDDRCVLSATKREPERHFLRGLIVLPVAGVNDTWAIGAWVAVAQADYTYYDAHYRDDNSAAPRFRARLANRIERFEVPVGTPVEVQLGDATSQPLLWLAPDSNVELARFQREGIPMKRVHEVVD